MSHDDLTILGRRPLAATIEAARIEIMRKAGMLAPAANYRVGVDALLLRDDVSVLDALDSASLLLRRADALLTILEGDDPDDSSPILAGLARDLVRLALGSVRVIGAGLGNSARADAAAPGAGG